jgi:hypothetical protein
MFTCSATPNLVFACSTGLRLLPARTGCLEAARRTHCAQALRASREATAALGDGASPARHDFLDHIHVSLNRTPKFDRAGDCGRLTPSREAEIIAIWSNDMG